MSTKPDTKIKVVGVGGSGGNGISRMMKCNIRGVELVAINADAQDLQRAKAHSKVRIGRNLTKGLGTGMNPDIGRAAAEEQKEEIEEVLRGADMVFIACGLGGGCGSGASSVVAEIAKKSGALTLAVVTTPFSFEGIHRSEIAQASLKRLKGKVDTLIAISNNKLLSVLEPKTTIINAFWYCDEILMQAVQGISDLIVLPGIINIDFADLKTILKGQGGALFFSQVFAAGPTRIEEATKAIFQASPLQEAPSNVKCILFNVAGGKDLKIKEVESISRKVASLNDKAKIIFGVSQLPQYNGKLKVSLLALSQDGLKEKRIMKAEKGKFKEKNNGQQKIKNGKTKDKFKKEKETAVSKEQAQKNKVKRRSALEVKKEEKEAEEIEWSGEREWEIPAFLRSKQN